MIGGTTIGVKVRTDDVLQPISSAPAGAEFASLPPFAGQRVAETRAFQEAERFIVVYTAAVTMISTWAASSHRRDSTQTRGGTFSGSSQA